MNVFLGGDSWWSDPLSPDIGKVAESMDGVREARRQLGNGRYARDGIIADKRLMAVGTFPLEVGRGLNWYA